MYVCMYVCVCVYIYIYIYIYVCVCVCLSSNMYFSNNRDKESGPSDL